MSALDRYFRVTERGSTISREIRGGLVTFVTMAYIVVLNPLIIGSFSATDAGAHKTYHYSAGESVVATFIATAFFSHDLKAAAPPPPPVKK